MNHLIEIVDHLDVRALANKTRRKQLEDNLPKPPMHSCPPPKIRGVNDIASVVHAYVRPSASI